MERISNAFFTRAAKWLAGSDDMGDYHDASAAFYPAWICAIMVVGTSCLPLTLGLGVGGRADDFLAAPAGFQDRGKRFDEQLAIMQRVWAGQPLSDGVGPVGPPPARPGGPEILIGGSSPAALRRLGRYGDGFIAGSADPASAQQLFTAALEAWQAAGRAGKPRFVGGLYYALGPDAATRGGDYLRHYYNFLGPSADRIAAHMITSPAALQAQIQAFQAVGMDELIAWPCIAALDQVDRLAEIVG